MNSSFAMLGSLWYLYDGPAPTKPTLTLAFTKKQKNEMIQSKKKWFVVSIRLLGSILFISYSFNELLINLGEDEYIYGKLLIAGFIGFMGILNLVFLLMSYEIEITESELIKKSFLGFYKKTILRERIVRFAEIDFHSEYQTKSLFLLGDKINIEISSTEISNYEAIKRELTKGLIEDYTYKRSFEKYLNIAGLMVLTFILIIFLGYIIF